MRRSLVLPAALAVALACGVSAPVAMGQTVGIPDDQARADYEGELARQCPDKQLQLLSVRDLRDGLDEYMASLDADFRDRLQQAEQANCASLDVGVACVNAADIAAVDAAGRIADLAASICMSFNRCSDQGVCDYAR